MTFFKSKNRLIADQTFFSRKFVPVFILCVSHKIGNIALKFQRSNAKKDVKTSWISLFEVQKSTRLKKRFLSILTKTLFSHGYSAFLQG